MKSVKLKLSISNYEDNTEENVVDYVVSIGERNIFMEDKTKEFLKNEFYDLIFNRINELNAISNRIKERESKK